MVIQLSKEIFKVDEKWDIIFETDKYPYATRYGEGNYDVDNIHFALVQRIESMERQLAELKRRGLIE